VRRAGPLRSRRRPLLLRRRQLRRSERRLQRARRHVLRRRRARRPARVRARAARARGLGQPLDRHLRARRLAQDRQVPGPRDPRGPAAGRLQRRDPLPPALLHAQAGLPAAVPGLRLPGLQRLRLLPRQPQDVRRQHRRAHRRRPRGALRLHRRDPRRRRRAHQRGRGLQHLPPDPGPLPPRRRRLHPERRRPGGRRHGLERPARRRRPRRRGERHLRGLRQRRRLRPRAPLHQRTVSTATGSFGWQDILVLESAPSDLRGVMAGVVTGARQDLLSHLNVLAAQRGTPNAFIADPLAAFAALRRPAGAPAASARSSTRSSRPPSPRPRPSGPSTARASRSSNLPDPAFLDLRSVDAIPTATAEDRGLAIGRFGGKVKGLATLYRRPSIPPIRPPASASPPPTTSSSCQDNSWELVLAGKKQTLSFADTITAWLADPTFAPTPACAGPGSRPCPPRWSSAARSTRPCSPSCATRIGDVFGDARHHGPPALLLERRGRARVQRRRPLHLGQRLRRRPRRRSGGDSACDPGKSRRPLDEGLKIVWASLWDFGAFEEREYYPDRPRDIAMGVLVSTQYEDEQANGVAFTGNPTVKGDPRYTINVQLGEVDVVERPRRHDCRARPPDHEGRRRRRDRARRRLLARRARRARPQRRSARRAREVLADIVAAYPVEVGEHEPPRSCSTSSSRSPARASWCSSRSGPSCATRSTRCCPLASTPDRIRTSSRRGRAARPAPPRRARPTARASAPRSTAHARRPSAPRPARRSPGGAAGSATPRRSGPTR
jgi:hypothetical protein